MSRADVHRPAPKWRAGTAKTLEFGMTTEHLKGLSMIAIFGRAVVLLATMAISLVIPAVPGASADPYPPTVETQVHVSVKPVVKENVKVKVSLRVSVNGDVEPTGEIKVKVGQVANAGAGQALARAVTEWSTTVRYEGDPIKVTSPGFAEGNYVVDARFNPDSQDLRRSSDSDTFVVNDSGPGGNPSDVDESSDGTLPDTGGPNWWWLIAGLVLVGGGAGVVVLARRRSATHAPSSRPDVAASV